MLVYVILVENLEQVKITDFGLAKMLEYNQEQIYGGGGKVLTVSARYDKSYEQHY